MFNNEIFCERLRLLRQKGNLTLEQVGKDFAVSKQTVSRWEVGDRLPALNIAVALADYFDVSLDYLVGRSDDPTRR